MGFDGEYTISESNAGGGILHLRYENNITMIDLTAGYRLAGDTTDFRTAKRAVLQRAVLHGYRGACFLFIITFVRLQ